MYMADTLAACALVALLAEGVDRNCLKLIKNQQSPRVALLAEGVDRNFWCIVKKWSNCTSPSSRRAWIEITPTITTH